MNVRVEMINGDMRQGRYVRHTDTHLIVDDGLERKIQLVTIESVDEVPQPFETCLENHG